MCYLKSGYLLLWLIGVFHGFQVLLPVVVWSSEGTTISDSDSLTYFLCTSKRQKPPQTNNMEMTYLEVESYRVSWRWIQLNTGKPIVEVERIAVQIVTEAHAASLRPRRLPLRPLRLHLPNKLFQHTSWPSL
ncbi:hypothetical protein V6N11_077386 [Hibiscus sabdariffa]|uniref:Uncharacterized protein n=1 Tax=Hibiscus sabdariffa TaxID=183260 RepID=A0ABR2TDN9_9ROSI